jgi:hypothetical protein
MGLLIISLIQRRRGAQDAMQLKQPDRIPIQLDIRSMPAEMYGMSRQDQHENTDKEIEMLEAAVLYFQPDSILGVFNDSKPDQSVGDCMIKFPGHGLDPNGSFRFVEGEYMKSTDCEDFVDDRRTVLNSLKRTAENSNIMRSRFP